MALKIVEDIPTTPDGYLRFWLYGKTLQPILLDVVSIAEKPIILVHKDDVLSIAKIKSPFAIFEDFLDINSFLKHLDENEYDLIIVFNLMRIKNVCDSYIRMLNRSDSHDIGLLKSLDYGEWETLKKLMADTLNDICHISKIFVAISEEYTRIGDKSSEVSAIGPSLSDALKVEISHLFPEVFRASYVLDKNVQRFVYRTEGTFNTFAKDESLVLDSIETSFQTILDKINKIGEKEGAPFSGKKRV